MAVSSNVARMVNFWQKADFMLIYMKLNSAVR